MYRYRYILILSGLLFTSLSIALPNYLVKGWQVNIKPFERVFCDKGYVIITKNQYSKSYIGILKLRDIQKGFIYKETKANIVSKPYITTKGIMLISENSKIITIKNTNIKLTSIMDNYYIIEKANIVGRHIYIVAKRLDLPRSKRYPIIIKYDWKDLKTKKTLKATIKDKIINDIPIIIKKSSKINILDSNLLIAKSIRIGRRSRIKIIEEIIYIIDNRRFKAFDKNGKSICSIKTRYRISDILMLKGNAIITFKRAKYIGIYDFISSRIKYIKSNVNIDKACIFDNNIIAYSTNKVNIINPFKRLHYKPIILTNTKNLTPCKSGIIISTKNSIAFYRYPKLVKRYINTTFDRCVVYIDNQLYTDATRKNTRKPLKIPLNLYEGKHNIVMVAPPDMYMHRIINVSKTNGHFAIAMSRIKGRAIYTPYNIDFNSITYTNTLNFNARDIVFDIGTTILIGRNEVFGYDNTLNIKKWDFKCNSTISDLKIMKSSIAIMADKLYIIGRYNGRILKTINIKGKVLYNYPIMYIYTKGKLTLMLENAIPLMQTNISIIGFETYKNQLITYNKAKLTVYDRFTLKPLKSYKIDKRIIKKAFMFKDMLCLPARSGIYTYSKDGFSYYDVGRYRYISKSDTMIIFGSKNRFSIFDGKEIRYAKANTRVFAGKNYIYLYNREIKAIDTRNGSIVFTYELNKSYKKIYQNNIYLYMIYKGGIDIFIVR